MGSRESRAEIVISALVSGMTERAAAEVAGCSTRTVRRIKADHLAEIGLARRQVAERIADALAHRTEEVIDRLHLIGTIGTDRDAVSAARVLLAEARAWRDVAWVVERLEAVEDELAARRAS